MKRLAIILPLLLPLNAYAEGYLVTPLEGGGVKVTSLQVTIDEWALVQGLPLEQDPSKSIKAEIIILEEGKPPRISYDSLENLDRRFGGDGAVNLEAQKINLDDSEGELEVDKPDVIPLDDIPEGVPIKLFADDKPDFLRLRDGVWRSSMELVSQKGCPAQLVPMIKGIVGTGSTLNAKFTVPYHPRNFTVDADRMTWKRVSKNGYVSEPFNPSGGDMPPGMTFKINYAMKAISPEKVEVWAKVALTLPKMMAAALGGSSNCVAEASGFYDFVK